MLQPEAASLSGEGNGRSNATIASASILTIIDWRHCQQKLDVLTTIQQTKNRTCLERIRYFLLDLVSRRHEKSNPQRLPD